MSAALVPPVVQFELLQKLLRDASDPLVVHRLSIKMQDERISMAMARARGACDGGLSCIWDVQRAADELRETAQSQLGALLKAVTSHVDRRRVLDPETGVLRKPRVTLWANLNQRQTLEVFWSPTRADNEVFQPFVAAGQPQGDYCRVLSTWGRQGGHPNTVLRLLASEYGGVETPSGGQRGLSAMAVLQARPVLKKALFDSLNMLLVAVQACCELTIGDWPVLREEGMEMLSPKDRAFELCCAELNQLVPEMQALETALAQGLARLGLPDALALRALYARARVEEVKPSAVYFRRFGRRVSALQLDKALKVLDAVQALQSQVDPLRAALKSLVLSGEQPELAQTVR